MLESDIPKDEAAEHHNHPADSAPEAHPKDIAPHDSGFAHAIYEHDQQPRQHDINERNGGKNNED